MKLIAHRGYSLKYKDNSIEAIKSAIDKKFDGLELDIQPCKTGDLCVYHDLYIDDKFIRDMSLDEIRSKNIHTLEDIFDIISEVQVYLDIKGNDPQTPSLILNFFKYRSHKNITFCSFNRRLLKSLLPSMKKCTTFEMIPSGFQEFEVLTRDMQTVFVHWSCLDKYFIDYCKRCDIEIYTYTHKTQKDLEYICQYDVDGIITNGIY